MRFAAAFVGFSLLAPAARADLSPPQPSPIPGGVTDPQGTLAFVASSDGIDAVDLATGQRRWTSREGEWPLYAMIGWLAVGKADPARANVLRVRWLRPADGKLLLEAAPIVLPEWAKVSQAAISAWMPPPSRGKTPARLHVDWQARYAPASGIRYDPSSEKRASGTVLLDPSSSAVESSPLQPRPDAATLSPGFVADRKMMYWSWTDWGASWSSTPRPFRIGAGGAIYGYFAQETSGERKLILHRWGPMPPIADVTIDSGANFAPIVSMDGRYVVLSKQWDKNEALSLHDLAHPGKVAPVRLPAFETGFRGAISVIGPHLYYVIERPGARTATSYVTERRLVALAWAIGQVRWSYALAPRIEAPPVPGR